MSERLVGAFLGAKTAEIIPAGAASTAVPGANENAPRGALPAPAAVQPAPAPTSGQPPPEPSGAHDGEHDVDACLCDHDIADTDHTDDLDLPPATDGVEGEKV